MRCICETWKIFFSNKNFLGHVTERVGFSEKIENKLLPVVHLASYSVILSFFPMILSAHVPNDFWNIPMGIAWGDIVPASQYTGPMEVGWVSTATPQSDALDGWQAPSLRLRKNIWENFPVNLLSVNDGSGTDRYAITWNHRNLAQWREEKSESYMEWLDYDSYCEYRLLHALNLHANRYVVEPARTEDEICVIAMVHDGDTATISTEETRTVVSTSSDVSVHPMSLKKISALFPVVWEQDGNLLRMKFHNKRLREGGESRTVVLERLTKTLKESTLGTYSPAPKGSDKEVLCLFTLIK